MERAWYEKPMRIAALQCNFEDGRTLEVADKWAATGFNVEQLFHPMADGYSALFDAAKHGDLLAEYLKRTRRNGLRVILYLNIHILGPSLEHRKDEWAQRSADGGFPKLYDTYTACCLNSPWREHFFSVLDSLAPFDIDGVFLDGPVVVRGGCRCRHCADRYGREFGGDLNAAADLWEFLRRTKDDFLNEAYARFKRHKPAGVFYMNLPAMHPTSSYVRLPEALRYNDIAGTEGGFMFYGPPKGAFLWKPSLAAKFLEAIAPEKPRVVFMAADQKPWSWRMHTPAETRLCIASVAANGANLWYGLHGSSRLLDTPGGRAGAEMVRFLAEHEDCFDATESAAAVAVMYSLDTERSYATSPEASDFYGRDMHGEQLGGNFTHAFNGVCDALARSSVPFDIVTDLDLAASKLARYGCVFLPTCACLSDASIAAVREYVAHGGNIVASFDTSLYTPAARRRPDFALADVFGARLAGTAIPYRDFNYFSPCGPHELFTGCEAPLIQAPIAGLDVAAESAQVLARFHGLLLGRYTDLQGPDKPALLLNRFGQGQSLYLAGTFAEMAFDWTPPDYRRILSNAAHLLARSPVRLDGGLGNVELVARRQRGRLIVHLINYAGIPPRPFERVAPQRALRLTVAARPVTRCAALVAGEDCAVRAGEAGGFQVEVPEFLEHETLVIE